MKKRPVIEKLKRFFRFIYLKLFRINDSPQRVAIGFGMGVFFGALPGTGPIAALFLAFILRVNRASALLGSLLTNTWISVPIFHLSLKAGALITGLKYQDIQAQWGLFLKSFHWSELFNLSIYKIITPILAGYFAISLCIGIAAYIVSLIAITYFKRRRAAL